MIGMIFLVAIILVVAGASGLYSAINLIPTELGFAYFNAGATATSAGAIVFALGLVVLVLDRNFKRVVTPATIRTTPVEGGADNANLEPAAGIASAGVVAAGAAAGAVAATAITTADHGGSPARPMLSGDPENPLLRPVLSAPEKLLEEFERDLFAGIEASPAVPPPVPDPGLVKSIPLDEENIAAGNKGTEAKEPGLQDPEFQEPEIMEPVLRVDQGVVGATADKPVPAQAPPSVSGLIQDADLAAVSDDQQPPLAPVSSLEVVGSYDSGGTRFTMYSDGSVLAAGPQGDHRYRSLDELRRHLDTGLA